MRSSSPKLMCSRRKHGRSVCLSSLCLQSHICYPVKSSKYCTSVHLKRQMVELIHREIASSELKFKVFAWTENSKSTANMVRENCVYVPYGAMFQRMCPWYTNKVSTSCIFISWTYPSCYLPLSSNIMSWNCISISYLSWTSLLH